jgi:hypothetical protein
MRLWALAELSGQLVTLGESKAVAYQDPKAALKASGPVPQIVEFIEVRQPPPRETEWGPGQRDHVTLGPGIQASLRITPDGRVKLTIPGGELDVTDGSSALGSGLHEAGARAAQIRVRIADRAWRRAQKEKP